MFLNSILCSLSTSTPNKIKCTKVNKQSRAIQVMLELALHLPAGLHKALKRTVLNILQSMN